MGIPVHYGPTAICLVLLLLPELVLCGCIFGGTNAQDLIQRNKTILNLMNETLTNYTMDFNTKIGTFSNFGLWDHIQRTLNVTADNYLTEGASMGRLLKMDWKNATLSSKTNWTDNRTLEAYIQGEFINPVHIKLQGLAVRYSVSFGIFRPRQMYFHFTGFNSQVKSPGSLLDLTCMAGSRFLWRFSTTMAFDPRFNERWSVYFAIAANMVESSFDQYYRKHDRLGNDFVRVNLLAVTNASNRVIMFMEAYFMNNSYDAAYITSLTTLEKIPTMYFNNGTKDTLVMLNDNSTSKYNYIVDVDVNINQTVTETTTASTAITSTTEMTTVATTNALGSTLTSSPMFTTLPNPLAAFVSSLCDTLCLNSKDIRKTITSPNTTTYSTGRSVTIPSITSLFTDASTLNTSTPALLTNTSTPTLLTVNTSNNSDNSNGSTTLKTNEVSLLVTNIWTATNRSNETTLTPSFGSSGQHNIVSSTIANANGTIITTFGGLNYSSYGNGSLSGNQSITGYGNGTGFGNQSTAGYGNGTGFVNQNTSGSANGSGIRTTFDPDPYFHASVSVIKKIYNDDVLLVKVRPMLPVTAKTAFFTITIPAALGIILFSIFCMVCFQLECCPVRRKTDKSKSESNQLA